MTRLSRASRRVTDSWRAYLDPDPWASRFSNVTVTVCVRDGADGGRRVTVSAIPIAEYERRQRTRSDYQTVNEIALGLGHDPVVLRGPSRTAIDTEARREVARILRDFEPPWSYPRIGRALGGRHHTSAMYLCGALNRHSNVTAPAHNERTTR